MPTGRDPSPSAGDDPARDVLRLTRSIRATWWYTAVGIVFLDLVLAVVWASALLQRGDDRSTVLVVLVGGLAWAGAAVPLLVDYRTLPELALGRGRLRALPSLVVAAAYGIVAGSLSGLWTLAVVPLVATAVLLRWPPGVRRRVAVAAVVLVLGLWVVDSRADVTAGLEGWPLVGFYSVLLAPMVVFSLWWWDVLVALDRARAAEGRLAATQERLRVATDVHDLQGHHLQVVALQLELAERVLAVDPSSAAEHVRAARASVDEARQGTRDLATRFRSAPLGVELANAVDLLRAAGTVAEATADPDVDSAPGDVLGAVVRETTTNVLRHGGGAWARLSLGREGGSWRFEIANDRAGGADDEPGARAAGAGGAAGPGGSAGSGGTAGSGGSGLDGLRRRAAEAGGTVEVRRDRHEFAVVVTVPDDSGTPGAGAPS